MDSPSINRPSSWPTGPAIDSRECLGAVVSNGRIFYTSQASGFVVSQTYGSDSQKLPAVWERR
jgi:hypothetical protein